MKSLRKMFVLSVLGLALFSGACLNYADLPDQDPKVFDLDPPCKVAGEICEMFDYDTKGATGICDANMVCVNCAGLEVENTVGIDDLSCTKFTCKLHQVDYHFYAWPDPENNQDGKCHTKDGLQGFCNANNECQLDANQCYTCSDMMQSTLLDINLCIEWKEEWSDFSTCACAQQTDNSECQGCYTLACAGDMDQFQFLHCGGCFDAKVDPCHAEFIYCNYDIQSN